MKLCSICGSHTEKAFSSIALKKYTFDTVSCPNCGFLGIENAHWIKEAYSNAISDTDTGLVARNIALAKKITPILFYLFKTSGSYVDIAGGTGLFTRLMRDTGFDFYWDDLYCDNVHARGFEYKNNLNINAITAFEVFEHLNDPISFIKNAMENNNPSVIFFTTEIFKSPPPSPDEWWYYAFDAGQHISFYQYKTLEILARKFNFRLFSDGGIYAFCKSTEFEKMERYKSSSMIRRLTRYKSDKILMPKTWSDHVLLRS